MNSTTIQRAAALSGAIAVILGAFGAHALKAELSPAQLSSWQTGVLYHFIHTLALLLLSRNSGSVLTSTEKWAARFFGLGIIAFSGSLYFLATKDVTGIGLPGAFGLITPLGGLFFISGWVTLAISRKGG